MRRLVIALTLLTLPTATMTQTPQQDALLARARALHKQVPLIDGHNDYPWALRENAARDLDKLDITKPQPTIMTDIARLQGRRRRRSVLVGVRRRPTTRRRSPSTLEQIDIVHRMMRKYPETFELALTADDIERIFKQGKIASLIGMEGGHSIDSSLGALRMFHRLGARYMTLTHSKNIPWADSATDTPVLNGLSPFGEQVVREMNWLGMLVDLSHVSPDTMEDAIRVSEAPVIFSHSSARAVNDVPRNVPDNILQLVPKKDGVVMVTFVPGFLSPKVAAWNQTADRGVRRHRPERSGCRPAEGRPWTPGSRPTPRRAPRSPTPPITSTTSRRSPASTTSASAATSTASRASSRASKTSRRIPR